MSDKKRKKKSKINKLFGRVQQMSKIFILDTNVLLHDSKSILAFKDNEVVIPLVVLDELDKIKSGQDEKARNARMVIRTLDSMRGQGNLSHGIKTQDGGMIRVELNHKDHAPADLDKNRADNRIISVALGLMKDYGQDKKVSVVSKDINLRVKCDALGVNAEDYDTDAIVDDASMLYSGWAEVYTDSSKIDELYENGYLEVNELGNFYTNQYILLRSETENKHSCLAKVKHGVLHKLTPRPNVWGISPRNKEQVFALDALFDPDIKLVSLVGKAGCGKTLLAAAAGIEQLLDSHIYKKLIMSRPIQPMGRDLGYLPGTIEEKMAPWMAPLNDNLELLFSDKGKGYLEMQQESGAIEIEALTYIRGRSIPKSYIIVDEAQNLTLHELKTIITRVGDGTKIVLTGDINQIDNPYIDAVDNGLSCILEKFKGTSIAAHITLSKGERSELATLAAEIL
jgi:PhoH-like ATPase